MINENFFSRGNSGHLIIKNVSGFEVANTKLDKLNKWKICNVYEIAANGKLADNPHTLRNSRQYNIESMPLILKIIAFLKWPC